MKFSTTFAALVLLVGSALGQDGRCFPTMDFDKDGQGQPTKAGDLAKNLWSDWGVNINSSSSSKPAMLFDTGNPTGGDTDLADDTEGMVLIISEDGDQNDPDDNGGGGTLTFLFDIPVKIDSIGLFDLEEQGTIQMWNANNEQIVNRNMVTMRDGEKERMTFNENNVKKMQIYFKGSGALTDVKFCDTTLEPSKAPTEPPTKAPTTPTVTPRVATDPPTKSPTPDEPITPTSPPGTKGDPHFKTHGGESYDFHGQCDLVLLDNPVFDNNLGMLIHIRTKIETWWSYVESAVVRIGDETLEINGGAKDQWLYTNGIANEVTDDEDFHMTKFAGLIMRHKQTGPNREVHIYLGNGERITMKTYNDFVKVEIAAEGSEYYKGSQGLLGRFPDGKRVARDGQTFIEEVNAFGQEWQVTPEEPMLFHSYEEAFVVPAGQKCAMPEQTLAKKQLRQRRLANGMPMYEAKKACSHLESADDRKACVFDVVATQDVNMASVW